MSKLAFSVPFSIISNKPTTTTEEFDAFHGFMLIKNIHRVPKKGRHQTHGRNSVILTDFQNSFNDILSGKFAAQ